MKPDFFHHKCVTRNNGCPCCQRDSLHNRKRLTSKLRRRIHKRELLALLSED